MGIQMKILIIGSAPDSIRARHWNMDLFDRVIVINNAWKVTTKWDELIFPHDFPEENFVIDAYKSLGINGVHIYDKQAKLVWSRAWDRTSWREFTFPAFEQPSLFVKKHILISNDQVIKNNNMPLTKAGFSILEGKLILFAATSIFQANLDSRIIFH